MFANRGDDRDPVDSATVGEYELELVPVTDEVPEWADDSRPRTKYELIVRPTGDLAFQLAKIWGGRTGPHKRDDETAREMAEKGHVKKRFPFWGSINDFEQGTDPTALRAFESVLLDVSGYYDAKGFAERKEIEPLDAYAREYYSGVTIGEDVSLSEIMETFETVQRHARYLHRLGMERDDVREMLQDVQERL